MKKIAVVLAVALAASTLVGCEQTADQKQQEAKMEQANRMMDQVQVPNFNRSLERENIKERLIQNNDAGVLQWIYPMSAGRVIGRFPVRGKVTSGNKRLTSTEQIKATTSNHVVVEAPDESGAYGSSGPYIFWFDPAGRYHQHQGDYFMSPVPYKLDIGNGTISVEIDAAEQSKMVEYDKQTVESSKQKGGK